MLSEPALIDIFVPIFKNNFRGTDMNIYALQYLGMPQITTSMILQAMDSIVNKFETKKTKIIFILVSDNPIHIIQNAYLLRMKKNFNVYPILQNGLVNNEFSVGVDMAILSKVLIIYFFDDRSLSRYKHSFFI